jgi:anti-anti-sigma regulatory factor
MSNTNTHRHFTTPQLVDHAWGEKSLSYAVTEPAIMPLPARLDSTTVSMIEEDLLLCIESGIDHLILDAAQTTLVTAHGVHCLLRVASRIKAVRGTIQIANLSGQAEAMVNACGLHRVIARVDGDVDGMMAKSYGHPAQTARAA